MCNIISVDFSEDSVRAIITLSMGILNDMGIDKCSIEEFNNAPKRTIKELELAIGKSVVNWIIVRALTEQINREKEQL